LIQFLLITIHVLVAAIVTVHVLLTKSDVRAALGWVAVAWLSPFVGALLYFVFGINRVTRRALDFAKLEHSGEAPPAPMRSRRYRRISLPFRRSASVSPKAH
jgi:cardiolipin synthase